MCFHEWAGWLDLAHHNPRLVSKGRKVLQKESEAFCDVAAQWMEFLSAKHGRIEARQEYLQWLKVCTSRDQEQRMQHKGITLHTHFLDDPFVCVDEHC